MATIEMSYERFDAIKASRIDEVSKWSDVGHCVVMAIHNYDSANRSIYTPARICPNGEAAIDWLYSIDWMCGHYAQRVYPVESGEEGEEFLSMYNADIEARCGRGY